VRDSARHQSASARYDDTTPFFRDRRDVGSASASKPRATPRSFVFRRGS
jgi:hypothetical protein